jgi:hypothetical protein
MRLVRKAGGEGNRGNVLAASEPARRFLDAQLREISIRRQPDFSPEDPR